MNLGRTVFATYLLARPRVSPLPRPLPWRLIEPTPTQDHGTHFSARAALVFACFADETWKMYDFLRPGVSVANADLRTALSSSLLCNSSGIGYSEGFFRSIFVPDSSNSMASQR